MAGRGPGKSDAGRCWGPLGVPHGDRGEAGAWLTGRMTTAVEGVLWNAGSDNAGERQDDRLGGLAQQVVEHEARLDGIERRGNWDLDAEG